MNRTPRWLIAAAVTLCFALMSPNIAEAQDCESCNSLSGRCGARSVVRSGFVLRRVGSQDGRALLRVMGRLGVRSSRAALLHE